MPREKRTLSQEQVLEQGNISFLYRPKVQPKEDKEAQPHTLEDIHRFYIVLHPHGKTVYRLFILGRKHMPDIKAHEKFWVSIEKVAQNRNELIDYLKAETYPTKTRGQRLLPKARPCGEGSYRIIHADKQSYLIYRLVPSKQKDEIQAQFNLPIQASYVISVKNQAVAGSQGGRRANYPKHLQAKLGSLRFSALESPDFLDYSNAELLLIGANRQIPAGLIGEIEQLFNETGRTKISKH